MTTNYLRVACHSADEYSSDTYTFAFVELNAKTMEKLHEFVNVAQKTRSLCPEVTTLKFKDVPVVFMDGYNDDHTEEMRDKASVDIVSTGCVPEQRANIRGVRLVVSVSDGSVYMGFEGTPKHTNDLVYSESFTLDDLELDNG